MKKIVLWIKKAIIDSITYVWLSLFGVYAGTRIVHFFDDPYMEDMASSPFVLYDMVNMFAQAIGFIIVFNVLRSSYQILVKKNFHWTRFLVFIVNLSIVIYGMFF